MGRFIVTLTDEHRGKLEAYRKAHGLRSEAEAVRHMIDNGREMLEAVVERATNAVKAAEHLAAARRIESATAQYDALHERQQAMTGDVAFGPVKASPGSRLKKPKGEK